MTWWQNLSCQWHSSMASHLSSQDDWCDTGLHPLISPVCWTSSWFFLFPIFASESFLGFSFRNWNRDDRIHAVVRRRGENGVEFVYKEEKVARRPLEQVQIRGVSLSLCFPIATPKRLRISKDGIPPGEDVAKVMETGWWRSSVLWRARRVSGDSFSKTSWGSSEMVGTLGRNKTT